MEAYAADEYQRTLGELDAHLDNVDVAELWSASGARWLTDPAIAVPGALVRRVVGLAGELDQQGAGLAQLVPPRGLGLLAERAATMGLPPSGRGSAGGASRLLRAADGWIVTSLARDDDVDLIPAWLGQAPPDRDDPWPTVETLVAGHPAGEVVERAVLLGLPCGIVGEVTDNRPVLASRLGDAEPLEAREVVVVNLAALWAGPLCADLLARLGARTITLESTRRPDGGRLARRFFAALHGRSESVAIDLTKPAGRDCLHELLTAADVVIEGSRPRALRQMGIDAPEIIANGPQVWVSITSHGRDDANSNRVGFGDDAAACGGLVGWHGDEPRFIADAVADPLTGLTAAVVATQLLATGGRWLADIALSRVASSAVGGWTDHDGRRSVPLPARPQARTDPGRPLPLGRDTGHVIRSLTGHHAPPT